MKSWIKKIIVAATLVLVTGNAWSAYYFVATDGDDILGDGGLFSPWATIHYAVAQATDGDAIIVDDGTYVLPGTLAITNEISLGGYNSTGVIIDTSSYGAGYGIKVEADNVSLYDFTLLPPSIDYPIHATFNHTMPVSAHTNLFLENITIENSNRTAFDIHGYDGVVLSDLTANGSANGNGIQLTGCTDVTVSGCSASGNAWGGLAFYASKAIYLNRACSNIAYDMAANAIADVYVEDEFGLVNAVAVSGATYQVDNIYTVDAAMHFYTAADAATAAAIADALNAGYGNTESTVLELSTGNTLVTSGLSIQSAIAAATPGDTITVAAGTYDEAGQIVIDKNLTIVGADRATTIIRPLQDTATDGDPRGWFLVNASVEFNLEGVTLDGNGYKIYQAIRQKGSGTVTDVTFHDIRYQYAGSPYAGVAIAAFGTGTVDVTDSTFDEIGRIGVLYFGSTLSGSVFTGNEYTGKGPGDWLDYGLDISAGANVVVSNNNITGCYGVALTDGSTSAGVMVTTYFGAGTGAEVIGNTIISNSTGILVGYDDTDTSVVDAHYNIFEGNDTAVAGTSNVVVDATLNYFGSADPDLATLIDGPISALPYYTDAALTTLYYPVYIGSVGYIAIQDAIDAANAGDTIAVDAGTFVEEITVDKALTIEGANTGIDAVNGTRTAESTVVGRILVGSNDVVIDGITLSNPAGTVGIYALNVSGLTVRNNIIKDVNTAGADSASGVYVKAFGTAVSGFTITGNDIFNIGSINAEVSTKGIYFGDSNGADSISDVLIQGNRIAAVNVQTADWPAGKGAYGIQLNYGTFAGGYMDNVQILDNIITDIEGLWVHGIGLETDTQNTVVQGNTISNLTDHKTPTDAVAVFFEGNSSGGSVDLSLNSFDLTAGVGVAMHPDDLGSYTVDASANYWGQASGPAAGQISDGVAFNSYYTDVALSSLYSSVFNITQGTGFLSIQTAVAAASPGDILEVTAGTYTESGQIVIDKDLTIIGADRATTIIQATQDTGSSGDSRGWFLVETGVEFTLESLTLDGNGFLIYQGIRHKGHGSITDVAFFDLQYNAGGPTYGGVALAVFGGGTVDVTDSTFDEIGRVGVLYFGSTANGSVFSGNTYTGKGAGDWLDYCLDIGAGANVVVSNNTITACQGVASSDNSTSAGVMVTDYYGSGSGSGAEIIENTISGCSTAIYAGYASNDLSTVVAQYNDLSGNELAVQATELVDVDATYNYFGDDPDLGTLIDGPAGYDPWWADAGMTQLQTLNIYVDDNFDSATEGWGLSHFATLQSVNVAEGTYTESGQIVVDQDLTIIGAGAGAVTLLPVYTSSGGNYDPLNGWIAVSEGVEFNLSGVAIDGAGQTIKMAIISRGTTVVDSCVIENIASQLYKGWGVCILNGTDSVVSNSEFYGIERIGVHVRGAVVTPTTAPEAVIENCLFVGDGAGDGVQYAVEFGGGGSGLVIGCTISNYLAIASDDSTSAGILATDYYGNGTDATIISNVISGCSSAIYAGYEDATHLIDVTAVTAHYNILEDNGVAILTTASVAVDATLNYFGSADPDFAALMLSFFPTTSMRP